MYRLETVMVVPIGLDQAPQKFLDQRKWAQLRAFASNELIALTYLNALYPDQDNPSDFFWGREGSFREAVHCYELGKELLGQCRRLLIERELIATGTRPNGAREMIKPMEWTNIWPMFATNRATGPDQWFDKVEILESTALQTPHQRILLDCMSS